MRIVPLEKCRAYGTFSPEALDNEPVGIIELADNGQILQYNATESAITGVSKDLALGRNFFTEVAPCTNNARISGKFFEGVTQNHLDFTIPYVFTFRIRPTRVYLQVFRDPESKRNWVIIKRREEDASQATP